MTSQDQGASDLRRAVVDGDIDWLVHAVEIGLSLSDADPDLFRIAIAAELAESTAAGEEAHVDRTVMLLAAGADARKRGADGISALEFARAEGHWLAALVMDRWGRRPDDDREPLHPLSGEKSSQIRDAVEWDRFRVIYDFLAAGVNVHQEERGLSLLMQAQMDEADNRAQNGVTHLDLSALLLAMGADPWRGAEGKPPLGAAHVAFVNGFTPGVLLFERWAHGNGEAQ